MAEPLSEDELVEMARDAQSHTVDGESTTAKSADDIIKLDQYAAAKKARVKPFRIVRTIPPGTTD